MLILLHKRGMKNIAVTRSNRKIPNWGLCSNGTENRFKVFILTFLKSPTLRNVLI